jgi:hypothetical protein
VLVFAYRRFGTALPEMSMNCYQHTLYDTAEQRKPEVGLYSGESVECLTAEKKIVRREEQIRQSGYVM